MRYENLIMSGFFESKDDSNELEDLLLEVPRPRNNNWEAATKT